MIEIQWNFQQTSSQLPACFFQINSTFKPPQVDGTVASLMGQTAPGLPEFYVVVIKPGLNTTDCTRVGWVGGVGWPAPFFCDMGVSKNRGGPPKS